jgi:hypothetical protein
MDSLGAEKNIAPASDLSASMISSPDKRFGSPWAQTEIEDEDNLLSLINNDRLSESPSKKASPKAQIPLHCSDSVCHANQPSHTLLSGSTLEPASAIEENYESEEALRLYF